MVNVPGRSVALAQAVTPTLGRRSFLAVFTGALIVDPERLLWVPSAKTISIPSKTRCEVGSLTTEITTLADAIEISLRGFGPEWQAFLHTEDGISMSRTVVAESRKHSIEAALTEFGVRFRLSLPEFQA